MAHTARTRRWLSASASSWSWAALSTFFGLILVWRAWPFLVDDAFIVARYAQRLALGQGYGFQPGPATDGVTGPLWLLPLAIAARLGANPVLAAKVLGGACAVAALAIVCRWSRARSGGRARSAWLALFFGSSAPLWIWSIGGLETSAAALLTTLLLLGALERPAPLLLRVGVCGGMLAWLRPELALLVGFALLVSVLRSWSWSSLASVLLPTACGVLLLLGFRGLWFGHFLPLSAHAKPPSLIHGAGYLAESLRAPAVLALLPFLGLALVYGRRADRLLFVAVLVHALAVLLAGGDWMAGGRLWVPIVPVACLCAAAGAAQLWRRQRSLGLLLALLACLIRAPMAFIEASAAGESGRVRDRRLPVLLEALKEHHDPVAILDIGAVGYLGERQVIDLGGLVEPQVAYASGGHLAKRIDEHWLRQRAPGVIVLHSRVRPRLDAEGRLRWFAGYPVERFVLRQGWVLEHFRVSQVVTYTADYYYVVLAPRDRR